MWYPIPSIWESIDTLDWSRMIDSGKEWCETISNKREWTEGLHWSEVRGRGEREGGEGCNKPGSESLFKLKEQTKSAVEKERCVRETWIGTKRWNEFMMNDYEECEKGEDGKEKKISCFEHKWCNGWTIGTIESTSWFMKDIHHSEGRFTLRDREWNEHSKFDQVWDI